MTNEEMLGVAEIVERATNRFNEQAARFRERSAAYDRLIADMNADHERKMAEHRASFGARTESDAKIIEGLRVERDGLLTQVQDQRAEIERLKLACDTYAADWDTAGKACRIRVDEYPLSSVIRLVRDDAERAAVAKRLVKERDALRAEVADLRGIFDMVHASLGIKRGDHIGKAIEALKSQTPKHSHPVKVGEWVRNRDGGLAQVLEVHKDWYLVARGHGWPFANCEPCDPPVDHDTPAGKEAAESVIRDFRSGDSEVSITGLFDDTKITVRREPDQDHGSRIVISDANDMGEANIYLTESGARQMATALIGLCDVRKVPQ